MAEMDFEAENTIIGSAYDAVIDTTLWTNFIRQMLEYTHSTAAILTVIDRRNPSADLMHSLNISPLSLNAYLHEKVKFIDLKQAMPLWKHVEIGGVINHDFSHYTETYEEEECLFYERCLKATGAYYIAGVLLDRGEDRWSSLVIQRSSNQKAFQQRELEFLKRIGTHIRKAFQINQQLRFFYLENQNLYQIMDAIKVGILLIDVNFKFHYANECAQNLMDQNKFFEFDSEGKIHCAKQYQHKFEQLIRNIQLDPLSLSAKRDGVVYIHNLQAQPFMLTAKLFNKIGWGATSNTLQPNYVILFISEKGQSYTLAKPYLKETYALSQRECEICELFLNGLNLEKIAEHCHLTMSSVRTYLKTIFSKMQCNSQMELLHKLMNMTISFEHVY